MIKCKLLLESEVKSWLRLQVEVRCIIVSYFVHKVSNCQLHFKLLIMLANKSGNTSELYRSHRTGCLRQDIGSGWGRVHFLYDSSYDALCFRYDTKTVLITKIFIVVFFFNSACTVLRPSLFVIIVRESRLGLGNSLGGDAAGTAETN